jgi:hypothetical protein
MEEKYDLQPDALSDGFMNEGDDDGGSENDDVVVDDTDEQAF